MMKKFTLISVTFLSLFLLAGCGSKGFDPLAQNAEAQKSAILHRPEREPDIMGIITSVIGNEVTVMKLEASKMQFGRPASGQEQQSGSVARTGLNPSAALGAVGTEGFAPGMGPRGMRPGDEGGSAGNFDREAMQAQRDKMLEEMKKNSLGTEKIIIPVGIPLVHGGGPNEDVTENNQVAFSEIKKDAMITIWLNKDIADRAVAEFAQLMGGGPGGQRNIQN